MRAAADLLLVTGTPVRGPGSLDLVIDATGAEVCIQMGMNAVRPGFVTYLCVYDGNFDFRFRRGTYVQVGFGPPDVQIPLFRVASNEVIIKSGWRYGPGD